MSRSLGLALLIGGLGGCHGTTVVLGSPYPDAGGADAGPVPTVEVLPNPLDFGGVSAARGSAPGTLTLLNPGSVPVVVNFTQLPDGGPFSGPVTASLTLPPGKMAPTFLGMTFTPTGVGPAHGLLSYSVCAKTDPDAGAQDCPTQSIRLQGNGF